MTIQFSPIGLPLGLYQRPDVSLLLSGAQVGAAAGNVTVVTSGADEFAQIGPLILPSPIRAIAPQLANATVDLVGAEIQAQAEELEGADAVIYIDGAAVVAEGGAVSITELAVVDEYAIVLAIELNTKSIQIVLEPADDPDLDYSDQAQIVLATKRIDIQLG